MNKNVIIAVVAIIVVGGGVLFITSSKMAKSPSPSQSQNTTTPTPTPSITTLDPDGDGDIHEETPATSTTSITPTVTPTPATTTASVKEFTVTGSNFKFDPSTITVKKGDKVKITFVNSAGFHDWVLDGYAKTKQINGGAQEVVEFTADKAGSFEYYCSVGQHRAQGMKGTLIVQ